MRTRTFAASVAAAVAVWACWPAPVSAPSFILVLVDTLRADHLGSYGFDGEISPNLDRLADQSFVFTNAFAPAPWTKPSVASLFTSLYPEIHGITDHDGHYWALPENGAAASRLPSEAVTLAEVLRAGGYRTAAFVANPWLGSRHGFDQGFELYVRGERTRILLQRARAWLKGLAAEQRYFLYLHLMDVHAPYDAPEPDYDALRPSPSLGADRRLSQQEHDAIPFHQPEGHSLNGPDRWRLKAWRAHYAAGVRALDRRLAVFLERLRRSARLDDAVLVITSDHGEELLEHGGWNHGATLFEEQLHVPLLVRPPGGTAGPRRIDGFVTLLDLMPTLVDLAQLEAPPGLQGRPIPSLTGDREPRRDPLSYASTTVDRPGRYSARSARFKLILDEADEPMLFDLEADPGETQNLAASQPKKMAHMRDLLLRHVARMKQRGGLRRETTGLSDDQREQLRVLGYVQ
jgi:arylsulfatase A-like enzyme